MFVRFQKVTVYKCPHANCPKKATTFSRKYDFDDHMRAHDGQYDCGICNMRLWRKQGWERHQTNDTHLRNVAKRNAELNK